MPPRVRLRQRPPNPTPAFAGRQAELAALGALIARSPVAVVTGPPGIGKTELVLEALRVHVPEVRSRTLFVPVPETEAPGQLVRDLVVALHSALGRRLDEDLLREPDDVLVDAAIDLAEQAGLWVAVDGLDGAPDGAAIVMAASRYAQAGRWVVSSRSLPHPHLHAVTVELGPLDLSTLMAVGEMRAPRADRPAIERAARGSGGSPWLFGCLLDARAGTEAEARDTVRGRSSKEALALLEVLAALPFEVPVEAVANVMCADERPLGELERLGLVTRAGAAVRVRDTVSELIFGRRPTLPEGVRVALADVLAEGEPEAVLDALALLRAGHAIERMRGLLAERGDDLLRAGLAPRLFRTLSDSNDEVLLRWRVRCAAEMGNPTALAGVTPRTGTLEAMGSPEDRLAWALTKFAHGDVETAEALAIEVRDRGQGPLSLEASLLAARCARYRGAPAAVGPACGEPALDVERAALEVALRAARGEVDLDRAIASVAAQATALPEALLELVEAELARGRWAAAAELLHHVGATPRGSDDAHLTARRARLFEAQLALAFGRPADAARALALVRPFVRTSSLLRGPLLALEAEHHLFVGAIEGVAPLLEAASLEAARGDVATTARLGALRARLSIARAEAVPGSGPWELLRRARQGSLAAPPSAERRDVVQTLAAALVALRAGEATSALELAASASVEAGRVPPVLLELEALVTVCDVLTASGSADRASWGSRLLERARAVGASRYESEAELCLALCAQPLSPGAFERLAVRAPSPIAARRARAVLGADVPLDPVDELVVRGARAELEIAPRGGAWSPAWGLDLRDQSVWLEDGRTIALASRPLLWSLLVRLAERSEATKEELVVGIWNESEYHPLRHDPRLQMSIRKLRELIEDDPATPTRVITVEGGYALRGCVRRVAPRSQPQR